MQEPWKRRQIIEVCICQQDNGWLWCCKADGFDWLSRKTVSRENNTVEAKSRERARHIEKSAKESKHKYSNIQLNFGIFQKLADIYSGWSQSGGRRRSIRNQGVALDLYAQPCSGASVSRLILLYYVCTCVSVWIYIICMCLERPEEGFWNWNYRWLWAAQHGCSGKVISQPASILDLKAIL